MCGREFSLLEEASCCLCRGSTERKGWEGSCEWMDGAAAAPSVPTLCSAGRAQAGSGLGVFIS